MQSLIVTLPTRDNAKLKKQISDVLKRSISWNKCNSRVLT